MPLCELSGASSHPLLCWLAHCRAVSKGRVARTAPGKLRSRPGGPCPTSWPFRDTSRCRSTRIKRHRSLCKSNNESIGLSSCPPLPCLLLSLLISPQATLKSDSRAAGRSVTLPTSARRCSYKPADWKTQSAAPARLTCAGSICEIVKSEPWHGLQKNTFVFFIKRKSKLR